MSRSRMIIDLFGSLILSGCVVVAQGGTLFFSSVEPPAHSVGRPIQQIGFDGQLTDRQTHWQFLGKGYRAYNPVLHRFMAQDSLSPFTKGGVNGYVFANNNPVMQFDPSGHFSVLSMLGSLIPHSIGGFAGLGAGSAVALGVGALTGGLGLGAWSFAGAALVGATSSAAGEYVGQGVDTGNWHPQAAPLLTAAALGGSLAILGDMGSGALRSKWLKRNTSRPVYSAQSSTSSLSSFEEISVSSIETRNSIDSVNVNGYDHLDPVSMDALRAKGQAVSAEQQPWTRGQDVLWEDGSWDSRIGEGSEVAFRALPTNDQRAILKLRSHQQALSDVWVNENLATNSALLDTSEGISQFQAIQGEMKGRAGRIHVLSLYQSEYQLSEQGRRVWRDYEW